MSSERKTIVPAPSPLAPLRLPPKRSQQNSCSMRVLQVCICGMECNTKS